MYIKVKGEKMKKKKILIGILILLISVCFGKATYNVYASDVCIAGNYYDKNAIVIVSQPISSYYTVGQKVVTTVKAEGDNLSYQWQFSFDGSQWQNWGGTGCNTSETWYDYPAEFNGIMLRCVITDVYGNQVITDSAKYTLAAGLRITEQPKSQGYMAGQKVVTTVKAEGDNLSYQWQFSFDGSNWQNWGGTGCNASETWYDYPAEFNGIMLRCVITDVYGNQVITDSAKYTYIKSEDWELPII